MAIFELHPTEDASGYYLQIQFDRAPLLNTLFNECPNLTEVDPCLQHYVRDHVQLRLDKEEALLTLDSLLYDDHHVIGYFQLEKMPAKPALKSVEVQITALLDVEEQYNIFRVMVGPRVRSFQLNKDRQSIKISL